MGLISRVSSRTYRNSIFKRFVTMGAPIGDYVQVYGRKKTASAVALCKKGQGLIKVNGRPLDKIEPECLRLKLQEPVNVVGAEDSLVLTSKSRSVVEVALRRFMPSVRLLHAHSSPTFKNLLTSTQKKYSWPCALRMTELCW